MPDPGTPGRASRTFGDGLRLAVGTLTVAPMPAGRVDRATAAVAMSAAPVVGMALGGVLVAVLAMLGGGLLAAAVAVAAGAVLTRGLHLDGLADTVDALGSYRHGAEALEIMKRADIGPFGVAAVVLVLLLQAAALAQAPLWAAASAWATGRLAITLACHRRVPAARPHGLGALVAGTVPTAVVALLAAGAVAASIPVVPGRAWQGPAATVVALAGAAALVRHAVRRLGGVTGDVLGAATEITTTIALVGLSVR
ncbi:adenosylcobinamide-GDP ribazoletransferase [Mangrovihabitans endophyticus]|uniref:Adenosylcobinamide-GDP ribazoletransferase n=1 Tax=Mangrovihabitans endophyticus TaxID=1751298 RepID=A0A8J3BX63_9ACTN|nr:adenosylcobinamide-GDP ribazoletransferase [Mangrovihabitans endophyticus]GGK87814.1 hypothetical protein GCM10012284_22340 [Mangrovihabitans endophyticus]